MCVFEWVSGSGGGGGAKKAVTIFEDPHQAMFTFQAATGAQISLKVY